MATAAATSAVRQGPRLGTKSVFLPNHVITLLRTPNLPASWASFLVPLSFNKLDLRDYLWNVYGVEVTTVRSFIIQKPMRRGKAGDLRPRRTWFRPMSEKRMMVEMRRPFVWPAEPVDYDAWERADYQAVEKQQTAHQQAAQPNATRTPPSKSRTVPIAEQAKAMIQSSQASPWKSTRLADWISGDREVETDMQIADVEKEKTPSGEDSVR